MTLRTIAACAVVCGGLIVPAGLEASEALKLDTRLAEPVMKGGATATNYLRVGLHGCKPEAKNRTPVNVAFVIDRSGSMEGAPMAQAREAAIMAVNRLGPDDIASVVIFDGQIDLLVPAQKVTDPTVFTDRIRTVVSRGSTAIHGGVVGGAYEVRKNKAPGRLNRVVLLSDGQANVGPSRVPDFVALGGALLADGISVSTIGLGPRYNEDLMLQLARASDGNHAFARDPSDLITIFNKEFDDVLNACAHTVSVDIELKPGVRPVRALSRDAVIEGNLAKFKMNQIYAATEHYVLLEVEVDETLAAGEQDLGLVKVAYIAQTGSERKTLSSPIRGRLGASEQEVAAARDINVGEAVVEQVTRLRGQEALLLRDSGRYEDAAALFHENSIDITRYMAVLPAGRSAERLQELKKQYDAMAKPSAVTPAQLNMDRKTLRELEAPSAGASTRY